MLKLALIETSNAWRRRCSRIEESTQRTVLALPAFLDAAFVVQLLHRVREYGLRLLRIRTAVDEHLAARQTTAEEAIRTEHRRQGVSHVSTDSPL